MTSSLTSQWYHHHPRPLPGIVNEMMPRNVLWLAEMIERDIIQLISIKKREYAALLVCTLKMMSPPLFVGLQQYDIITTSRWEWCLSPPSPSHADHTQRSGRALCPAAALKARCISQMSRWWVSLHLTETLSFCMKHFCQTADSSIRGQEEGGREDDAPSRINTHYISLV